MKKMKKKRMAKFEAHCTKIFRPYVEKVMNNEEMNLSKLLRAIDGIVYQYVGDEEQLLIFTNEVQNDRIMYLANFIILFKESDLQFKKDIAEKLVFKCKFNDPIFFNNYLMELPFGVIEKSKPYFFYYKEPKSEIEGEGIESETNVKSEPPELDY